MAILKELPTLIFILGLLQLSVSKHVHKGQAYKRHLLNVKRQLANQACCAAAQAPPMCCEQSPPLPSCCQPGIMMAPALPLPPPPPPQQACCISLKAPTTCCQSSAPPSCCQSAPPVVPPPPPPPQQACCASVQAPSSCCQSSTPPPCCQSPVPVAPPTTLQSCCASVKPLELSPSSPDNCCQSANAPPCCVGLGLKPGQAKNITLNGGGRQFLLQVKLIPLLGQTIPPTANPTTIIPSGTSTAVPTAAPTVGSTPSSGVSTPLGGPTTPVSSTVLPSGGQVGGQVQDIAQCRQAALAETNIKRQLHAAPAMTLDPKLNQDAQAWATKIAVDKNPTHSAINTRPGQGENVANRCQQVDMPFDENCKLGVDLWYKESNNYDFQSPGYSPATGHFTQLVWKASTRMGIGRASYVRTTGIKCVVLVARYSPPGNVKLQFPQNVQPATGNVLSDKPSDKQKKPRKPVYLE